MSSHFLDSRFMRDLVEILKPEARFEHEAIHAFDPQAANDPVHHSHLQYLNLGYRLVKVAGDVVFVSRHSHRVELIPTTTSEHVGYVFPYGEAGRELYHEQVSDLNESTGVWKRMESGYNSSRSYALFRHTSTDLVLQVLHRERPLFEGIEW